MLSTILQIKSSSSKSKCCKILFLLSLSPFFSKQFSIVLDKSFRLLCVCFKLINGIFVINLVHISYSSTLGLSKPCLYWANFSVSLTILFIVSLMFSPSKVLFLLIQYLYYRQVNIF